MGTSVDYANTRWCVFVARPEFLAKPAHERTHIAQAFFAEHIEPIARITYVDVETFRTNFVTSATLSLQQVPIKTSVDAERTRYRDIHAHAWHGGIQLSHMAFARDTLLAGVLGGAMLATVLSPLMAGRWASWGFAARLAFVLWVAWMVGVGGWFWHASRQEAAVIAEGIEFARHVDSPGVVTSFIALAQTQAEQRASMAHPLTVVMVVGVGGLGLPLLLFSMLRGVLRWVLRGFKRDVQEQSTYKP
jgi:hypothetical protein